MSWIEKVRNKPQEEKIHLIWITVVLAAVILLALWIVLAHFSKDLPKDTSLFKTVGKGIKDVRNNYKK